MAITSPEFVSASIIIHGRESYALAITASPEGVVFDGNWDAIGGLNAITLAAQMYQLGITTLVHTRLQRDGTMSEADLDHSEVTYVAHITDNGIDTSLECEYH